MTAPSSTTATTTMTIRASSPPHATPTRLTAGLRLAVLAVVSFAAIRCGSDAPRTVPPGTGPILHNGVTVSPPSHADAPAPPIGIQHNNPNLIR
ncbi:MAG: hypothetical protein H0X38_12405 [Planctomycetes bacterium]|nr:hypothetical protein [Planctomycetota bacterium]